MGGYEEETYLQYEPVQVYKYSIILIMLIIMFKLDRAGFLYLNSGLCAESLRSLNNKNDLLYSD